MAMPVFHPSSASPESSAQLVRRAWRKVRITDVHMLPLFLFLFFYFFSSQRITVEAENERRHVSLCSRKSFCFKSVLCYLANNFFALPSFFSCQIATVIHVTLYPGHRRHTTEPLGTCMSCPCRDKTHIMDGTAVQVAAVLRSNSAAMDMSAAVVSCVSYRLERCKMLTFINAAPCTFSTVASSSARTVPPALCVRLQTGRSWLYNSR